MKNKKPLEIVGIIITAIVLVGLGFFLFKNQANAPTEEIAPTFNQESENTTLANPASVNCEEVGGTLTIMTRPDGGQYRICDFGEGMACEEWALYNETCPLGGVDTSGLETEEQKYCLWIGGNLTQTTNTCTLPDENVCDVEELYSGNCPAN